MSLPRYPHYRDSGVEWLGRVPSHWNVLKIKRLSQVKRGASPRPIDDPKYFDDDGEYSWVRIADVSASDGMLTSTTQRMSPLGSSLSVKIQPGDLFVSIAGTVGKPCISGIRACIHDGFVYFPSLAIPPRYLFRLFEEGTCYAGLGKLGTQLNLNTDTIGSISIALPPPDELEGVLAFLNRETAKIDALIAEQEKLIALLAEKRQATISHAVTKGLTNLPGANSNAAAGGGPKGEGMDSPSSTDVPMKDSGVPWLGEVPAHWEVLPLKRFLSFLTSGSRGWAEHYSDDGAIFLRIGNLTRDSIELDLSDIQRVSPPEGAEGSRTRVEPGDVLFSITAFLGSVATVPEGFAEAYVSQHVALARLMPDGLQPRWVAYTTLSDLGITYLASQGYGGTKIQLSLDDIRNLPVTVPPPHEQQATLQFLDTELTKLRDLRCEAEHAVALLRERRSALIAAAVTGQIDVRGAVSAEAA